MNRIMHKSVAKTLRKRRVRAKVIGTTARPRASITISNTHISVQIINDSIHKTLVAATTVGQKTSGTMTEKAAIVGKTIGTSLKKAKITKLVIDRNGHQYAARLKALTDAIRNEGIEV